jgi:hypothetical protein
MRGEKQQDTTEELFNEEHHNCFARKFCSVDQIKDDQVGEAHRVWRENLKEIDSVKDLSIDGKKALKWVLKEISWQSVDSIYMAQ